MSLKVSFVWMHSARAWERSSSIRTLSFLQFLQYLSVDQLGLMLLLLWISSICLLNSVFLVSSLSLVSQTSVPKKVKFVVLCAAIIVSFSTSSFFSALFHDFILVSL